MDDGTDTGNMNLSDASPPSGITKTTFGGAPVYTWHKNDLPAGTYSLNFKAPSGFCEKTLTVTASGTGSGYVTSSPIGIDCGRNISGHTDCTQNYNYGTSVVLTRYPSAGSNFTGWSGACSGTSATCTVSMTAARSVTATFTLQTRTLTVTASGTGSGYVTSSPVGIDCGRNISGHTDCTQNYNYNTSVILTRHLITGSNFTGWSGACSGTSATCTVSMTAARSVTATFTQNTYTLTVNKTGSTGTGTVTSTSNPTQASQINCGIACSTTSIIYNSGTSVTLYASPNTGSTFTGWLGDPDCTDGIITINANKTCTATFVLSNQPPVANFSCSPANCTVYTGQVLTLNNSSSDPDNNLVRSEWDILGWGSSPDLTCCASGCNSTNILCNYTVQSLILGNGTFNANLTVKDALNATGTLTKAFNIKQDAVADFVCSLDNSTWASCHNFQARTNQIVYFLDQSSPSEGAVITSWAWNFQNATPSVAYISNPQSSFNSSGIKTVSLIIGDSENRSASKSYNLRIEMLLPEWEEIIPIAFKGVMSKLVNIISFWR